MITIKLVGLLILAGIFHITRDKIRPSNYKNTVFYRFPEKFQKWFNPEISWNNKKSKYAIWQLIKSIILVDFTDLKHFLKFLEINTCIFIVNLYITIDLETWIKIYIARGIGVFIGNLNWFGKINK